MSQMTLYLDQETENLVRQHVKNSGESASRWVAEAVRQRARAEWPSDVASLLGSWGADDFPDAEELRGNRGTDVPREEL